MCQVAVLQEPREGGYTIPMFLKEIAGAEWKHFLEFSRNARILTYVSSLFALAWPIFTLFMAAFVMRKTGDVVQVVVFQLSWLTGVPIAAYSAAPLLRRFKSSTLYSAGMLISAASLVILTGVRVTNLATVVGAGFAYGLSNGLLWANRNLLVLENTTDGNRNYFFGIEYFVQMVCGVLTPAAAGYFIEGFRNPVAAYRWIAAAVLVVAAVCAFILSRGAFTVQRLSVAVPIRFDAVWTLFCGLAFFKGVTHMFAAILPVMLVARVLKSAEGTLGLIQSIGTLATAAFLYWIGRQAKPEHRLKVWAGGAVLYFIGTAVNAWSFTPSGTIVCMGCLLLAQPTMEMVFSTIQMAVIDREARRQPGSAYAYLCAFEAAIYTGRLASGALFLGTAVVLSGDIALRYGMLAIGVSQFLALPVASALLARLRGQCTMDNAR
jgi:YQGE family putative transporter